MPCHFCAVKDRHLKSHKKFTCHTLQILSILNHKNIYLLFIFTRLGCIIFFTWFIHAPPPVAHHHTGASGSGWACPAACVITTKCQIGQDKTHLTSIIVCIFYYRFIHFHFISTRSCLFGKHS